MRRVQLSPQLDVPSVACCPSAAYSLSTSSHVAEDVHVIATVAKGSVRQLSFQTCRVRSAVC